MTDKSERRRGEEGEMERREMKKRKGKGRERN